MMAWLLAIFIVAPLLAVDGWLRAQTYPTPDLTIVLGVYLGLFARPSAIPALLVLVGVARGLLLPGDAALHVLALGLPIALLVPVRALVFRRSWIVQVLAAAFLVIAIPRVGHLLGRFGSDAGAYVPDLVRWGAIVEALCCVPPAVWLFRRVPPFAQLQERSE